MPLPPFWLAATIPQARALVLSGAPDVPETYNSVMNAIFSAQKAGVLVDCAVLGESSTFLQQAAYLTGELGPRQSSRSLTVVELEVRTSLIRCVGPQNIADVTTLAFEGIGFPFCATAFLVFFLPPAVRGITGAGILCVVRSVVFKRHRHLSPRLTSRRFD